MKIKTLFEKHLVNSDSKQSAGVKAAKEYGYTVTNGIVYNKKNKPIKTRADKKGQGYLYFDIIIEHSPRFSVRIYVHRLAGYIKYGDKIFEKDLVVRHLDGDSRNNLENNLALGTQRDNFLDIPKEIRRITSLKGAYSTRKFTDEEISNILNELNSMSGILEERLISLANKYNCSKELIYEKYQNNGYKTSMPIRDCGEYVKCNANGKSI